MASKYKQQKDGRYKTRVWDGTYKDGAKHYTWLVSTKSSKDLERIVAEYEILRDKGAITVSQSISVQEYARQWKQTEKGLSESATKAMYDNVINVHLKDFATLPFENLTRQGIQMIINDNSAKPRTCQQIIMTLKQICKAAERDRLLPIGKTNELFDRIQIPKYKAEEKKPLTDQQCQRVYDALVAHEMPPRSALFVSLIYFCGLRREEALAVKNEDIHSLAVTVDKALHLSTKGSEIKVPKTERGYRSVPLPPEAIPIIEDAVSKLDPNPDGYLFTMKDGKLMSHSAYVKMWNGIEKILGFECTAHIFRHTFCTRLCYEAFENRTISVKQIARLLGDTDKMVTDVYGHLVEEREQTNLALRAILPKSCQPFVNELSTNSSKKYVKIQ